jgi:hypothetical protein
VADGGDVGAELAYLAALDEATRPGSAWHRRLSDAGIVPQRAPYARLAVRQDGGTRYVVTDGRAGEEAARR